MEKRSWWRKKSSKHSGAVVSASVAVSANTSPVNRLSKRQEDHGMSKFLADQVQELTLRFQESEEKLRAVNAKLAAAQAEITDKEDHVKQHAKVAEEAVSGWEKAEEETASVKLQLDTTTKRLEDKISALDAAHKDAIRTSQKAREEHERKMQEMVTKKNKECERVRAELESRLSEVGHRLLESTAESKVLAATLQERMRTISELAEARSKAEAEINVLNVRLDSMDKDNLTLQYEIQVLNKQLQIRNEEKDYCKREADAALKHTQDGLKKIQFLEAECQRLRTLVRRKLPGPAAVAQMKQEADAWGREERRRSFGSCRGSGEGRLSGGIKDFQVQLLTERVLSMEEETKMLREVLSQKNNELETARMNFVAASMTPSVHSETASSVRGGLKPRQLSLAHPAGSVSETSVNNEDDVSAADAWTSNLISELDLFKKEKGGGGSSGILVDDSKFQMMDDFAEMEQLAGIKDEEKVTEAEADAEGTVKGEKATDSSVEQLLAEKEEQLQAANRLCMEISSKLVATEKDFAALQAKNAANELSLIKLQEKLDFIVEAQGDRDFEKMFAEKSVEEEAKKQEIGALSENIHKVICLVEALAHAMGLEHSDDNNYSSLPSPSTTTTSASSEHSSNHSSSFEKLTMASNKLTAEGGNTGLTDFIGELCAVLNMMAMNMSRKECSLEAEMNNERLTKLQKEVADMHDEAKRACEEVSRVKVEKELLHESCEKANQRLREAEAQLKAAEALVSELKKKLSQSSQFTADMEERLKAADGTVGELREKLMTAERKYESERERHQALVIRYAELERQITISSSQSLLMNGHANANDESNSEEIAAKLAECQETILALGKKLKVLSSEPAVEPKQHSFEQTSYSTEGRTDSNDAAWSRIKIQGFEPETLTCWSPPRSLESAEEQFSDNRRANNHLDNPDSTWLYSPDHAGHRRTTMRSPGRFLSKKASNNELTKSVNFPLTPKVVATHGGSSFSRFFSRNRNAC